MTLANKHGILNGSTQSRDFAKNKNQIQLWWLTLLVICLSSENEFKWHNSKEYLKAGLILWSYSAK